MKKLKRIPFINLIGLLILTACSSTPTETLTAQPLPTAIKATPLPTPASPGNSIVWHDLQVTLDQVEITGDYITEFGISRSPSEGEKFMWAHIQLENVGQIEVDIPLVEHYSALYAAAEFKPTYGHRQAYTEYSTLGPTLFPNEKADAWIRFDIPLSAELKDLRFIFIPESSHIGASFSSPNFPYGTDKPTYVWKCSP